MKRRNLIKALTGGIMMSPFLTAGTKRRYLQKRGGGNKKLVVLFQRGGNDGLNTLVPISSGERPLYDQLRPTLGIPTNQLLPLDGFFGMHPGMSALQSLYNAGNLKFIHAVGYPGMDRSHFESQGYFETAIPGDSFADGWLNRFLASTTGPGLIRGISIGSNIPQAATGSFPIPVSFNFGSLNVDVDDYLSSSDRDVLRTKIRDTYNLSATPGNTSVYDAGTSIFQMIDSFSDRNLNDYVPENNANYPNSGLGRRVMHAAQMLKDDTTALNIEVVTIDQGGYDTHANQLDPATPADATRGHGYLLNELAGCMFAFNTDMGATRMQDIVFMVVSEFGRRAYENSSNGTDHGRGCVAMIMGNGINGGNVGNSGGDWPGLANLYQNDDIDWVTDFRDIYWEILSQHMGADSTTLQATIPGHTYTPAGIFS